MGAISYFVFKVENGGTFNVFDLGAEVCSSPFCDVIPSDPDQTLTVTTSLTDNALYSVLL